MSGGIGFYVHHHGRGHANRTQQIVAHLDRHVTVFGSSLQHFCPPHDRVENVSLPSDVISPLPESNPWPDIFHYAPLGVPGIRERMFRLAQWAYDTQPSLLVVDVSVEVTLFARLLSIPTVIVRQNGLRDDLPHQAAFQSSSGLLAPYPAMLEDETTPDWVRTKTYYAGGFSRYGQRELTTEAARAQVGMRLHRNHVVVMNGLGGEGNPMDSIVGAARTCPQWDWWVVGPTVGEQSDTPANIMVVGRVEDTFPYLRGADVVVGSAGNNTVMEVATAGTPYICIPEDRPFQEQREKAKALDRIGAACVLPSWPEPDDWEPLLEQTKHKDTQLLSNIIDPEGAANCARYLEQFLD